MIDTFNTTDLDELTAAEAEWDIRHRPVGTDRFEGRLVLGRIGDIRVDLESWNTAMEITGTSPTRQATQDLRRWWKILLDLSARGSTCVATHDLLLDETLLIIAHALGAADEDREPRSRRRYVLARRARDYLLERQMNPPTIAEACAYLGTSERTLHHAFSEMYGVSPKRFLKAQRLLATRRALEAATAGEHVSDIAIRLGFWDMGYFARDYRAMFGELPSATLRKAGG